MTHKLFLSLVLIVFFCPKANSQQAQQQASSSEAPHAVLTANDIADLQKKADSGDAAAAFALGNAYDNGSGVRKNSQQAATWYRKAAEQGDAKAENSLGVLYWIGEGVEKDKKQAVGWYKKAARQGNGNAMFNLGAAYYNGEGVANLNDTLAFAWFLLASEAGSESGKEAAQRSGSEHGPGALNDACFVIGEMYSKGDDLPHDLQLAAKWYKQAAEKGHSDAQVNLAMLAMKDKHYDEGRKWCELAAKGGHSGGAYCLGYLYQHGMGATEDSGAAIKYYRQAAASQNKAALHALTEMYVAGKGTKQNRQEALLWNIIAARRGGKDPARDALQLRSLMSDKEWQDIRKKLVRDGFDAKQLDEIFQAPAAQ